MKKQRNTFRTIGMDQGDKKHVLCVLNEDGEVVLRTTVRNRVDCLAKFFDQFDEPARVLVVMESGTHSPWISHLLSGWGFEVMVGNARKLRAIYQSDRKNDDRDAEMLARIGRFDPGLLYPIQHRSMSAQADLSIIRARDAIVRCRTDLINCARGLVKSNGGRLPSCSSDAFASKAADHVPPELAPAINPLLSQISSMTAEIRRYDRCIERLCEHAYPETAVLRQISGVGCLTSLAFVLTLEDPTRFPKNRAVGAFLGLTPKQDQSGDTDKALPISKAGDAYMRRLLSQSSNYILGAFGPDCDLRRFGERIFARGGKAAKRRAVTAVSRKLSVLLLHLWKTQEDYEPFHRQLKNTTETAKQAA